MNYTYTFRASALQGHGRQQERSRTIIFVSPPRTVPEGLKQAAESEFPWAVVEEVAHIDEAIRIFPDTVSLILVHKELVADAERRADDLFRFHPLALTALLDDGTGLVTAGGIVASKLLRGVLPIHVRLEVSLSIMAVLLSGIEYFPRAMLESLAKAAVPPPQEGPPEPEPLGEVPVPVHLKILTKRELQVLRLVERGLQNKSIATDLNLSGHTVKIHLHNIISKLGARNRTEAAALYRGGEPTRVVH
ncbi:MAG: LuxR family transcriptional regulator [Devosia sp.]|uniref:helix-turn-helix transcriptional regulator n=1 Tax=Devosia sp. TaxID=1871048 RepID=UPI00261C2C56|nr:response regulator transcription factor [Devosia sp.]MDB5540751.1 LuxR family transcriptional regulator [Devosia sp.]